MMSNFNNPVRTVFVVLLFVFAGSLGRVDRAHAADHSNLEEGLPIRVEDAYPIGYQGREMQGLVGYERANTDEDVFVIEPRLEYGLFRNSQIAVRVPFYTREGEGRDSGNANVDVLYNFMTEPLFWPAVSLAAGAEIPTGSGSAGVDPRVKLILTKTIPPEGLFHRLHLNVEWRYNAVAADTERRHRVSGVLGYEIRATADSIFLTDFVWEEMPLNDRTDKLLEVGWRTQVTPLTTFGAGLGAGLDRESTDFRATLAFQQEITFF